MYNAGNVKLKHDKRILEKRHKSERLFIFETKACSFEGPFALYI